MKLRILQLNMYAGTYWQALKDFLEKEDFDILCFQEVNGPHSYCGNVHCEMNCFIQLQTILGKTYASELSIVTRFTSDPTNSYQALATFYRKSYQKFYENTFWLYRGTDPFPSESKSYETMSKNILHLGLRINDRLLNIVNAHLAWGKTPLEYEHQGRQNKKFVNYISQLSSPFIITGDFNIQPDQPTVLEIEKYARNLTKENNITNTLNSRMHRAKELFPPGVAVDYIFVSKDIKVDKFEVLENLDISDHLGLVMEMEF